MRVSQYGIDFYRAHQDLFSLPKIGAALAGASGMGGGYMGSQFKPMSEQIIDEEIRQMVGSNYLRAETNLKQHFDILHNMAHALLDWGTIDKYQIDELMQGKTISPPEPEIEQTANIGEQPALNGGENGARNPEPGQLALS